MYSNCINCGAAVDPKFDGCPYCGTVYDIGRIRPLAYVFCSKKLRKKTIYPALIALGVLVGLAIYGLFFDSLSETALVALTPIWFFLITFGLYGYHAEKLLDLIVSGQAEDIRSARKAWLSQTGRPPLVSFLAYFYFFAVVFINLPRPALIALTGSAAWGLFLLVFFKGIFPAL